MRFTPAAFSFRVSVREADPFTRRSFAVKTCTGCGHVEMLTPELCIGEVEIVTSGVV
jgi:hypothetical protein